jgi:hypothetical protein
MSTWPCRLGQLLHGAGRGQVHRVDAHVDRVDLLDLFLGRGQRHAVARGQLQVAAFGRERMGGCEADAFGGAGDEYGLAFEFEFHDEVRSWNAFRDAC